MEFEIPDDTQAVLDDIDAFIKDEIKPLEERHPDFFNHRREESRTNWADGTPSEEWVMLIEEMKSRADEAGFYRMHLPEELGGDECDKLTLTAAREHITAKGPGLHNIIHTGLATEMILGDWRNLLALYRHGSEQQKNRYLDEVLNRETVMAFGMTEPEHGSDPSYMDTSARNAGKEWIINGQKRFIGGMHGADVIQLFARTSGEKGSRDGITTFLVPTDAEGLDISYYHWVMNMPSTQAEIELNDVRVPEEAVLGEEGKALAQVGREFLHDGWLAQATWSLGTAQFCVDEAVEYANSRKVAGKPLSTRQGIQFPLVDLHAEIELVRNLVYKIAWMMDENKDTDKITELLSIANYRSTNLACDAADQAMQVYGGKGWTRHYPFEYLYRQFRRYRITEGADEVQKRRAAGFLFGFI